MSEKLTVPQKAVIIRADRNGGFCDCPQVRGEALERKGYGQYQNGHFHINIVGIAYARHGVKLEDR